MEVSDLTALLKKHKNVVLNVVIILLAVNFALKEHKKQNLQLQKLVVLTEEEAQKNEVLKKIGGLEESFQDYKSSINDKDVTTALDVFNKIASGQGVKIISVRPLKEKTKGIFTYFPFDLRIETDSYHKLGSFIAGLENHKFIFDIGDMKITPFSDKEQNFALTVNLQIETFIVND